MWKMAFTSAEYARCLLHKKADTFFSQIMDLPFQYMLGNSAVSPIFFKVGETFQIEQRHTSGEP
jgi:hypothetical protein